MIFNDYAPRTMLREHNVTLNSIRRSHLLFPVYKIHNHLDKDVHFVHPAFGDHQGQCDEGTVSDSFGAILTVEDAVVLKEPQEQGRSNPKARFRSSYFCSETTL